MSNSLQVYDAQQRLEYWTDAISRCRSSDMTVRAWCIQEGISEKTYYYWQKKVFKAACQGAEFIEIPLSSSKQQSIVAEITVNGVHAAVCSGADADTLQNLIVAMKTC